MVEFKLPPIIAFILYLAGFAGFGTLLVILLVNEIEIATFIILAGIGTLACGGLALFSLGDAIEQIKIKFGKNKGLKKSHTPLGLSSIQPSLTNLRDTKIKEMAERGDKEAVEFFCNLVINGTLSNKLAALNSLGRIGDKQAIPVIKQALNDEHVYVRAQASIILAKLEPKETDDKTHGVDDEIKKDIELDDKEDITMSETNIAAEKKHCIECGFENLLDAKFCKECGTQLREE